MILDRMTLNLRTLGKMTLNIIVTFIRITIDRMTLNMRTLGIMTFYIIVITILYHKVSWTPELSLTSKEKTTGKPK